MSLILKSHGKLLITGEYFVLRGAKALCIPTKYYQSLEVKEHSEKTILWKSFDSNGKLWIEAKFSLPEIKLLVKDSKEILFLQRLLLNIKGFNPNLFNSNIGFKMVSSMNFNKDWGLGSSSTLINNLSNWANINPFNLLWSVSNGSGYDIAVSVKKRPIIYELIDNKPSYYKINFKPKFHNNLFFIYINKKQISSKEVDFFNKNIINNNDDVLKKISLITEKMIECEKLIDFQKLIYNHETIISKQLNKKSIKEEMFSDYRGEIKSLGAWGGDFILAAGSANSIEYFKNKGFKTIISFADMLKKS